MRYMACAFFLVQLQMRRGTTVVYYIILSTRSHCLSHNNNCHGFIQNDRNPLGHISIGKIEKHRFTYGRTGYRLQQSDGARSARVRRHLQLLFRPISSIGTKGCLTVQSEVSRICLCGECSVENCSNDGGLVPASYYGTSVIWRVLGSVYSAHLSTSGISIHPAAHIYFVDLAVSKVAVSMYLLKERSLSRITTRYT